MSAVLDPRAIEEEIARIREKESNPYSSGTKTNIFTLLIFRADEAPVAEPSDPVETVLQFLPGKPPARIITIRRSRGATAEAWVSGRCFPTCGTGAAVRGGPHRERRRRSRRRPGAWSPLVIRDLPVFAWLPDGLSKAGPAWTPALRGAAGLIDKVLVDSSRGDSQAAEASDALQNLTAELADASLVSDFSWRRGRVLREQAARAFDPLEMRALLPSVRAVRLYGGYGWKHGCSSNG